MAQTRKKKEINEEFLNIWAEMLYEKHDKLIKNADDLDDKDYNTAGYYALKSRAEGMLEALTLFNCLEEGKFESDYKRIQQKLIKKDKAVEKV